MIDLTKITGRDYAYIRLYENRVVIKNPKTNDSVEKKALLPFSSSRLLLADFIVAENLIREILPEIYEKKLISKPLAVLFQPMEKTEGGLSRVEKASFNDLAVQIGGRFAKIEEDKRELSNQEVIDYFG